MIQFLFAVFGASPRSVAEVNAPIGIVIAELAICVVLIAFVFLMRRRFFRLMCACGAELCLFFACNLFFGENSLITLIMCWVTAAVACIVTVAIVNRIDWKSLRGKNDF